MNTAAQATRRPSETPLQQIAQELEDARLVSIFGENRGHVMLHYLIESPGNGYHDLECIVTGPVPSMTHITPAAAWHEREIHDRFGVEFVGHPALASLLRHNAEAGDASEFLRVQGHGVCEVPVGPVHAGTIEPGHFRFSVIGDTVLHLQLRLFYTHKGTENLFEGTPALDAVPIAESVSGDNCFAHAVAYCQAVEQVYGAHAPGRANALRLVGLEFERLLAHIGDFGALCGDVGFSVPAAYCARIKEDLFRASANCMGTRYWRGLAVPGGMRCAPSNSGLQQLGNEIGNAVDEFQDMAEKALNTPSVQDRFEGAGVLSAAVAKDFAVVGPVARACGIPDDVRRNHPYGAYKQAGFEVPSFHYGDVMSRARVRLEEAVISVRLISETLQHLPEGPHRQTLPSEGSGQSFAAVESPRGELVYWVQLQEGKIRRCHVRSPSFQNWPALPFAVAGNIIADFPLINKSFNLSYSGCDR